MQKLKSHNYKRLPAACLLAVYLFFSFITIAGYRTAAGSVFHQNVQTALICSHESYTSKETAAYKKHSPPVKKITTDALNYNLIVLLTHNRLVKVKLYWLSKNVNPFFCPVLFVQQKIIPENSGEHNFPSFIA